MKREVRALLTKATDSVLLATEHFNRPWNRGRSETVLVLLDRAFELVLKAVILHRGGRIRERRATETLGLQRCVNKCLSETPLQCLSPEEAVTVQIINGLRDAAQHYIVEISEQQLYVYAQAGLTLFDKILRGVFRQRLSEYFPERILLVCANPPKNLESLMKVEFEDIKNLVRPDSRKGLQARAKLRPFAIVEESLKGAWLQPAEWVLNRSLRRLRRGENWQNVFPGIKCLTLSTEGDGLGVVLRITKHEGEAVHLVPKGTEGATVVAVKRVNDRGFYSLNLTQLAAKVGMSMPKTLAVVKHLKLQDDPEYFKIFTFGSAHHKCYSPKALHKIKAELPSINVDEAWKEYVASHRKKAG